ncbi:MAG: prolyl oligopeptidase family serine peptidase [Chitinophagaceae bacterium]
MKKRLSVFIPALLMLMLVHAQQKAQKFVQETQYLLYLPDAYNNDTTMKWPLVLFLHGSGEAGVDIEKIKVHGPPKLIEAGKKFPFIVVSPQAPPNTGWQSEVIKGLLDDVKKKYRVDNDRVYLTGLSMGGFGTWDLAEKYPNEFAAIVPICGGGDTSKVWKLRHTPVWCFHGALDNVVPIASSQRMVDALKPYNANVKFTVYPTANHNSWEVTYNNDSVYTWMLSQKKFVQKAVAVDQKLLKEYTGTYVNNRNDTLVLNLEDAKLIAMPGHNQRIELKASSPNTFFWDERSIDEATIIRNKKNAVVGLIVYGGEKDELRKIK